MSVTIDTRMIAATAYIGGYDLASPMNIGYTDFPRPAPYYVPPVYEAQIAEVLALNAKGVKLILLLIGLLALEVAVIVLR